VDTGNAGWTQMSLAEEEECRQGDILHRIFENLVHQGASCTTIVSNRRGRLIKCPPSRPIYLFYARTMTASSRFSLRRVGARCPHHILDFDDEPNLQDFLAEEHHFLEYSHPCLT